MNKTFFGWDTVSFFFMVMRSGYKANKRSFSGIYYRVFREEAGYMVLNVPTIVYIKTFFP